MKTIKPVFKCHASNLSQWILTHFPENHMDMTYIEPFCGGANLLLSKKKSKIEIINDLDINVINIYRALRDEPKEFIRRLNLCKYCEETFNRACKKLKLPIEDYLDHALNEFIATRMSKSGMKKAFAWNKTLQTTNPKDVNAWLSSVKSLPELAERLKEVFIFNKSAIEIIQAFNGPNTLVYCDPPYLHEARVSKTVYSSEMPTDDHIELSHILNNFDGKVIISGYASPLYNRLYKGWNIDKKKMNSSQKKSKDKKVEVIWKNF